VRAIRSLFAGDGLPTDRSGDALMAISRRALIGTALAVALAPRAQAASVYVAFADYEAATGGRLFLYAQNITSGEILAHRPDERVVMCSTFKASLAACVLARIDQGRERRDRMVTFGASDIEDYAPVAKAKLSLGELSVGDLCQGMLEMSDSTCANLLLTAIGGPAALTAFWRNMGDDVSRLDHTEPVLNRSRPGDLHDTTSPRAMAGDIRQMLLGERLSHGSRAQLQDWMALRKAGSTALRDALPAPWRVVDRTGSNGTDAAGHIGVAWPQSDRPIVFSAYTQGGTPTSSQLDAIFAEVGRAIGQDLG
jgi:beta-lactamase class A